MTPPGPHPLESLSDCARAEVQESLWLLCQRMARSSHLAVLSADSWVRGDPEGTVTACFMYMGFSTHCLMAHCVGLSSTFLCMKQHC